MDPVLLLLVVLGSVGAVLLYLRLFGPPLHTAVRYVRMLRHRRPTKRAEEDGKRSDPTKPPRSTPPH
jgi:hypothetical protein